MSNLLQPCVCRRPAKARRKRSTDRRWRLFAGRLPGNRRWLVVNGWRFFILIHAHLGNFTQTFNHQRIHTPLCKAALIIQGARWFTDQQTERLIHPTDGIDMKHTAAHRLQHTFIEHQRGDVGTRDNHALLSCQPARLTKTEETFDFLVDPADGLHFAELVDRTGDGKALLQWPARNGRDQCADLTQ